MTDSFSLSCGFGVVVLRVVGRVASVVLWVVGGCVWDLLAAKVQIEIISKTFQLLACKGNANLDCFPRNIAYSTMDMECLQVLRSI